MEIGTGVVEEGRSFTFFFNGVGLVSSPSRNDDDDDDDDDDDEAEMDT
tara:strand:- start:303 stop:446 length:144 start_codon:yes stop_codon:yes gene_type:complete